MTLSVSEQLFPGPGPGKKKAPRSKVPTVHTSVPILDCAIGGGGRYHIPTMGETGPLQNSNSMRVMAVVVVVGLTLTGCSPFRWVFLCHY